MHRFQFHPVVGRWFQEKFGSPTEPQEQGWPAIQSGQHTLIAAPTGSGKTLAAFLASLDQLFRQGHEGTLRNETRVLYVSPLKALSNDIHKNLQEPLTELRAAILAAQGQGMEIRAEVRTGDTKASKRQAILRKPPHILATTPESFYLMLTSEAGRKLLKTVRTVILDEIHAVVGSRRGSHLALSMERLSVLASDSVQRIGLSATQKPIEEVARFLVGERGQENQISSRCQIIDIGHRRQLDLAIELPGSPLEAVMSNEVWTEVYERLGRLIEAHQTTLVFVNTRRLAERITHHLANKLGEDKVTSHHGSLSADLRHDAEKRLKQGTLRALVATASLELGIDIGSVDLVCQIGPTRSIATFLQRVGRAEHRRDGLPKGRLFPLTRDELIECVATLRSVRQGDLDALQIPEKPLDILAQQIVASVACEEWDEQGLFDLVRSAYPYRQLTRAEFDEVIRMLAEGFSTKRGRRGALIHHDGVNKRVRARRGARLTALTSGGAIPDNADYRVILHPTETFIGTVNEDFAIESMAGDIFQLGNASWKIVQVNSGTVRVEDAHGQPPGIPFWLGEAPGRTRELSYAVSEFRREIEQRIEQTIGASGPRLTTPQATRLADEPAKHETPARTCLGDGSLTHWLMTEGAMHESGAQQVADYFCEAHRALGLIPSQKKLVMERFFDESGGMQLVIHAPFGSRLNRAWGLALRKRFCRSFNFELQAAATDDAIVLSLGMQHSFPLEDVFRYLNSRTVRGVLVQALLDAPMFTVRWRWNTARALALPRHRGGNRVPAPLQRMQAEDLIAAVFPDQLACLENIAGDREVPNHPLVRQTIDDCLTEAMDVTGLEELLLRIERGEIECIARDLPEPSPLAHEILNAKPYAFLDNAPLEERRTQAVYTRRANEASAADGLGILDAKAIERVCQDAWPRAATADELHEALMLLGIMSDREIARSGCPMEQIEGDIATSQEATAQAPGDGTPEPAALKSSLLEALESQRRAGRVNLDRPDALKESFDTRSDTSALPDRLWVAAERVPLIEAIYPGHRIDPSVVPPAADRSRSWERDEALRELVRGRVEVAGPVSIGTLANDLRLSSSDVEKALLGLEGEGFVLRGKFHPGATEVEWCDRRLLARIHRLTLNNLRAEIQPVTLAEFQRFLFEWQRVAPSCQGEGPESLGAVLEILEALEMPAAAWEPEVIARRIKDYTPQWLDQLCFTGRVGWGRLIAPQTQKSHPFPPLRSSPVSLFSRLNLPHWLQLSTPPNPVQYSPDTELVWTTLRQSGALFFGELAERTGLLPSRVEDGLAELASHGWITADSFEGLRAMLVSPDKRIPFADPGRKRRHKRITSIEFAGRWSMLRLQSNASEQRLGSRSETATADTKDSEALRREKAIEKFARVLLKRYGVMFRKLLTRECLNVSWFELSRVYRRLEARGEIRGGHFVGGVSGEQFALPEAIGTLRSVRRKKPAGELITLSAADPLNLLGILTPGPRLPAIITNKLLFRDGLPVAMMEAGRISKVEGHTGDTDVPDRIIEQTLRVGSLPPALRPYYG